MNRLWVGLGLLLALLAVGLGVTWAVSRTQAPVVQSLEQAQESAWAGNWADTEICLSAAQSRWRSCWRFSGAVFDHAPMEEVDALFAEADACCRSQDRTEFTAACARLIRQVEAMQEAHSISWWNLL